MCDLVFSCFVVLDQGLKHTARGPHVTHEDVLCGPRCFLVIFVWLSYLVYSPVF